MVVTTCPWGNSGWRRWAFDITGSRENISHFLNMKRDSKAEVILFRTVGGLWICLQQRLSFIWSKAGKLLGRGGRQPQLKSGLFGFLHCVFLEGTTAVVGLDFDVPFFGRCTQITEGTGSWGNGELRKTILVSGWFFVCQGLEVFFLGNEDWGRHDSVRDGTCLLGRFFTKRMKWYRWGGVKEIERISVWPLPLGFESSTLSNCTQYILWNCDWVGVRYRAAELGGCAWSEVQVVLWMCSTNWSMLCIWQVKVVRRSDKPFCLQWFSTLMQSANARLLVWIWGCCRGEIGGNFWVGEYHCLWG